MSLTVELSPDTERALHAKAARLGMPVERYVAGVLRRDVEHDEAGVASPSVPRQNALTASEFLALYDELSPAIVAGTRHPITPEAISEAIAEGRP